MSEAHLEDRVALAPCPGFNHEKVPRLFNLTDHWGCQVVELGYLVRQGRAGVKSQDKAALQAVTANRKPCQTQRMLPRPDVEPRYKRWAELAANSLPPGPAGVTAQIKFSLLRASG